MKTILSLFVFLFSLNLVAQEETPEIKFWENLTAHCGKAYEGRVVEAPENDDFRGKKLVMHVRACEAGVIRIPFFVGEDRSRTWVLKQKGDLIELKHDHRHEDGTEDEVTMYGGTASNHGLADLQVFPADSQTAEMLPPAASNVWWITLTETTFNYNLRRIGTDRFFSIEFDLTKPVPAPEAPWGWAE